MRWREIASLEDLMGHYFLSGTLAIGGFGILGDFNCFCLTFTVLEIQI